MTIHRKSNRLAKENYQRSNIYFLTLSCFNKAKYFDDEGLVNTCLEQLRKLTNRFPSKLWTYCFMPDHMHLILETAECEGFVRIFKQFTGYSFKKQTTKVLWQKSYYDHVLREDEDLPGAMAYVLNNPVRAKMVNKYLDYPFLGSFEIDVKDFIEYK